MNLPVGLSASERGAEWDSAEVQRLKAQLSAKVSTSLLDMISLAMMCNGCVLCFKTELHEATCKAFIDAMDARYEENRQVQANYKAEIAQLKDMLAAEGAQELDESHTVLTSCKCSVRFHKCSQLYFQSDVVDSLLKSVLPEGIDQGDFLEGVEADVATSLQPSAESSIEELIRKAKEEVKAEYDARAAEVHALNKQHSEELHDRISQLKRKLKVSRHVECKILSCSVIFFQTERTWTIRASQQDECHSP